MKRHRLLLLLLLSVKSRWNSIGNELFRILLSCPIPFLYHFRSFITFPHFSRFPSPYLSFVCLIVILLPFLRFIYLLRISTSFLLTLLQYFFPIPYTSQFPRPFLPFLATVPSFQFKHHITSSKTNCIDAFRNNVSSFLETELLAEKNSVKVVTYYLQKSCEFKSLVSAGVLNPGIPDWEQKNKTKVIIFGP
jgi:hypothetical protein